jgi:hypothetical protein
MVPLSLNFLSYIVQDILFTEDVMYTSTLCLWRMLRSKKNVRYNLKKLLINNICVSTIYNDILPICTY